MSLYNSPYLYSKLLLGYLVYTVTFYRVYLIIFYIVFTITTSINIVAVIIEQVVLEVSALK